MDNVSLAGDYPTSCTSPYKIIVGIDYGTTYSGVAYVTSNRTSDDIVIFARWPNHVENAWKSPTVIAYSHENPRLNRNHWGFEVSAGLKQYVWTKLLLDSHVNLEQHDDPLLRQMYGAGFLQLPANKTAKDVAKDFLHELYRYVVRTLREQLSGEVFETMAMECWITVPAIWSHAAEADTRDAAVAAGFGSRPFDKVYMIKEPEAAALSALRPHLSSTAVDPIRIGEHVLILDCGGGTVDLITYEILKTAPMLEHREKARGTGAKCGATAIDRRFVEWMTEQFGEAYSSLDHKKRGPGSFFMKNFESVKRNFGDRDEGRDAFDVGPIDLDLDVPSLKYDEDERSVRLSRRDMQGLFDPPINHMIQVIEAQEADLRARSCKIDRVILVGGFGDSQYLHSRLKEWCTRKGVRRFTCPPHCQAAIVNGAVLRGLEGIKPTTTIARRHYGWSRGKPFREGVDDELYAYTDKFDNTKWCRGRMRWVVHKDQEMDETFEVTRSLKTSTTTESKMSTLRLFSCSVDPAPDREEDFGVREEGTIEVKVENVNRSQLEQRFNRKLGKIVYQMGYDVHVSFRSDEGVLTVKTFAYGREAGTANISFQR